MQPIRELHVPRRFVTAEDRFLFVCLGTWAIVQGVVQILDPSARHRLWLAPLWPSLLVTSGVCTLAFLMAGMRSFRWRTWAGSLMIISCAGRAAALTLALRDGTGPSAWGTLGGFGVWSMMAVLLYVTWRARVPWAGPDVAPLDAI